MEFRNTLSRANSLVERLTGHLAFTFLLFLIWLVFFGAGKLSLDALLRRILRSEPAPIGSLSPEFA